MTQPKFILYPIEPLHTDDSFHDFNPCKGIRFTLGTRKFTITGVWRKGWEVASVEFMEEGSKKVIVRSWEYLKEQKIRYKGVN